MNAVAHRLPGGDTKFERPDPSRTAKRKHDQRVIDALDAGGFAYTNVCAEVEEEVFDLSAYRIQRL
jgi:hypothetical protein